MDDDFLFNNKTKIELLVEVLEKTELDVVRESCQVYFRCNLWRQPREGKGREMKRGMYVRGKGRKREEERERRCGRGADAGDEQPARLWG